MSVSIVKSLAIAWACGQKRMDSIQHPVDKRAGISSTVFFGQFDCFIQSGFEGNVRAMQKFEGGQAQNITVHHGHALQGPMFRVLFDEWVDLTLIPADPLDQALAKLPGFFCEPEILKVEGQN